MSPSLDFAVRGFVIGVAVAATVGPIWLLCLRRALDGGFAAGLASGAGAAVADALYGAAGAFGVGALGRVLGEGAPWLALAGGAFLIALGVKDLVRPVIDGGGASNPGRLAGFATTFVLTLANPLTILSFAAIFAGLGLGGGSATVADGLGVVLGVFAGSLAWWVVLSAGAAWLRGRLAGPLRVWINRTSGLVLIGFGLAAIGRIL